MLSYVYIHRDPETHEVRYVGAGSGGRAWTCDSHRSSEHRNWLTFQFNAGHTMADITSIIAQKLHYTEALAIEREEISQYDPTRLFNVLTKPSLLVMQDAQLLEVKTLRLQGKAYAVIAAMIGVSTMTVYRALNNQTRGYHVNASD